MGWLEVLNNLFLAYVGRHVQGERLFRIIFFFLWQMCFQQSGTVFEGVCIPFQIYKVIVWIRRFLFMQNKPLSLPQKFWPWAWRPLSFVVIKGRPKVLVRNKLKLLKPAVEPRETRANDHFDYHSPRINSAEHICCGIVDGRQGRTQRCREALTEVWFKQGCGKPAQIWECSAHFAVYSRRPQN